MWKVFDCAAVSLITASFHLVRQYITAADGVTTVGWPANEFRRVCEVPTHVASCCNRDIVTIVHSPDRHQTSIRWCSARYQLAESGSGWFAELLRYEAETFAPGVPSSRTGRKVKRCHARSQEFKPFSRCMLSKTQRFAYNHRPLLCPDL